MTAKTFEIQVLDARSKKNEKWNKRFVSDSIHYSTDGAGNIIANTANDAIRAYCPSTRKRGKVKLGKATTAKGKTFRAVPLG